MNLVKRLVTALLILSTAAYIFGTGTVAAQSDDIDCKTEAGFCVVISTGLPLRLLVKPQSNIYGEMNESVIVQANVPGFDVLIAFDAIEVNYDDDNFAVQGWYKVGPTTNEQTGYMKASDVVEWRQALTLTYNNGGATKREPVLMFSDLGALETTVEGIEKSSIDPVQMYSLVYAGNTPDGIVSREPDAFTDINNEKQFYVYPILSFKDLSAYQSDGGEMQALQIAALTQNPTGTGGDACDLQQAESKECIAKLTGNASTDLKLDVVFVIDMTSSMQPHIDAVSNAVRLASQKLVEFLPDESKLKFGLVGYRDNTDLTPELEFVSKNFTKDLVTGEKFGSVIGNVRAAKSGSDDWPEEVFAGVKEGLESNWSPDAARVIVLIGDASAHEPDHPSSTTKQTEQVLRTLADENKVYIASIYIGNPESPDAVAARPQLEELARNKSDVPAFAVVSGAADLEAGLRDAVEEIIKTMGTGNIAGIASGTLAQTGEGSSSGSALASAVRSAFVDYIGKEATPPGNIVAWVSDHDLVDFQKKSFDVRVMVTKKDLQDLSLLLAKLTEDYRSATKTTGGFFSGLQGGSVATSLDIGVSETEQFVNTTVVPLWIKQLPYTSEVLTLSIEKFRSMSPDERERFESRIESLGVLYDDLLNRTDNWTKLNDQASIENEVYMLMLKDLP